MKKLVGLLLCLVFLCSCALADVLTLDLTNATDEELASALEQIVAEQKSRIKTTLTLDVSELTIAKGKNAKLTATVDGLPEGVSQPKLTWSTSDKAVATVANGNVTAVNSGEAVISCSMTLPDSIELIAECQVTVFVAITNLSVKQQKLTLDMGCTETMPVGITPANASNQVLAYTSSDTSIASVSDDGTVKAVGPGQCTVTATTTDGTDKHVSCNVTVTPFSVEDTSFTVTSKKGESFSIQYYGKSLSDLNITSTNAAYGTVSYELEPDVDTGSNSLIFTVIPLKAGNITINVTDKATACKVQLQVKIDSQAVYSAQSYPKIQYSNAARYPDTYEGQQTSFSGYVLQVMDGDGYTVYRISSDGKYKDVVFVLILDADITVPLLEDDQVTVYGKYNGNYSYESVRGDTITIPMVIAERINIR